MASQKKYPKAFYDDGLGDILEWIDDEVLVHSSAKRPNEEGGKNSDKDKRSKNKKAKLQLNSESNHKESTKRAKLYGDNDISEVNKKKSSKKPKTVSFDAEENHDEVQPDKKLGDRVRGLINRLAAQTMPFVTSEFEKLYSMNSRSSVTAAIFDNIESGIISEHAIAKRKLVAELMLLVTYLDHKVSHSIGASIVHKLVVKFERFYLNQESDDDKRLDNITFCLVNLYITGLLSAHVIFEFTKRICNSGEFRQKSIELLLIVIRSIGFQLRKDNPSLMRQLITMAQNNANQLKSDSEVDSKVEFMIDVLGAVKNNNISKIGNYGADVDRDTIESTLKSLIQRTRLSDTLSNASYDEILNSANWYLLETRVDEDDENDEGGEKNKKSSSQKAASNMISNKTEIKICKALGLNKPTERTIFSALLKVSDFVEASNIIIGFGMNYCSDAMLVCVHVAIHEKKYNPFHFNLINNLCKFNRRYKMATKFTIQDKIRILSEMKPSRVDIFKRLCLELIQSDAIPITILKAVDWSNLNDSTKEFLSHLLQSISRLPEDERRKIMGKVDKKDAFAGAMRTFTSYFMEECNLFD